MFLCDYHMHSNNSPDGKDTIFQMAASAIIEGLEEIAISDHFEPSSGNENYLFYNADKYFSEIQEANQLFTGRINIKTAVELGQPHLFPESSLNIIRTHNYDYVLASAHKMPDNKDFGHIHYNQENLSLHCLNYLHELRKLAEWKEFDCLGHLDLVKRYAANFNLDVRLIDYKERVEEILKILIHNGKGIEVNTSGLRQASKECLPNLDIISFYKQLGGEIITIGSDAHNSEDVGKGILDALEIIGNAGFDYFTVYTDRKPRMIRIASKPSLLF